MSVMKIPLSWLLEGPAWVQYRTHIDLLGKAETDPEAQAARAAMLADPQIQQLLNELAAWPGPVLKRHNDASHPLHKLVFLAGLGLHPEDPGIRPGIERILEHQSSEGPFQVTVNIPTHFGGSGQDELQWMLCDSPLVVHALLEFGLQEDDRVRAAIAHLAGLVRPNGWPCAASAGVGRFRGPGRREDPCPYANLVMLQALALHPDWVDSDAAHTGAEMLLRQWTERKTIRYYLFAMGSDFGKLKAPLIWFDILHLLDVLGRFPRLRGDPRLGEMADLVRAKADADGRFTPESVWMAWKEWDFGQKKQPSRGLTLLAHRALKRLENSRG
jgi:hypothetical protein